MKNTFLTYSVETENLEKKNKIIREGIVHFNAKYVGKKPDVFSVIAENDNNVIVGGAIVYAHKSSIYIDILWVHEAYRTKGIGSKILDEAENEAIKRNIPHSTLDTFGFQAEAFYIKNGYQPIGTIPDYLEGYDRIYLRKKLIDNLSKA